MAIELGVRAGPHWERAQQQIERLDGTLERTGQDARRYDERLQAQDARLGALDESQQMLRGATDGLGVRQARQDHATGEARFIYHGNDGTSMPWNDTAQLDYLNPEVREAVIQTILSVARRFPIIRFDAAMTLAKKHYQRLWFPLPGDAGAIPSRAEHGMSRPDFDAVFPHEFWREVVDRYGDLLVVQIPTAGMERVRA